MICPDCGGVLGVIDSRPATFMDLTIVRRIRRCHTCKTRHPSVEMFRSDAEGLRGKIAKEMMQKLLENWT